MAGEHSLTTIQMLQAWKISGSSAGPSAFAVAGAIRRCSTFGFDKDTKIGNLQELSKEKRHTVVLTDEARDWLWSEIKSPLSGKDMTPFVLDKIEDWAKALNKQDDPDYKAKAEPFYALMRG